MIKVRIRGTNVNESSFGDAIAKRAHHLGMTAWTITPYDVTLRTAKRAAWLDLAQTLNAIAYKLGGRLKCAATPGYHYEIIVREAAEQRRAA